MKKNRVILVFMLLLWPTLVLAKDASASMDSVWWAIFMEAVVTVHMSLFVLFPIAKIFKPNNPKPLFIVLFIIRVVLLLYFDFFVTTGIAVFDFMFVFIGAFLVVPILYIVKRKIGSGSNTTSDSKQVVSNNTVLKSNVILKCTKCGSVLNINDKFCPSCGAAFDGDNVQVVQDTSPVVQVDRDYLVNEKTILKKILGEELKTQGEDEKKFITTSLNTKRNILLVVFWLITLLVTIMYYFNYSLIICLAIELIALLIYYLISKQFNIINVLAKKAIKSPDTNISSLVSEAINVKHNSILNGKLKFIIVLLIGIVLPTLFFADSKILYTKYEDGYSVFRYTRGLIKQENEVTVPDTYKGKRVIAIGESAFENSNVQVVNLPVGLEIIKTKGFRNCKNIQSIDIPYTVKEIRGQAFENDINLTTVTLQEGLKEIRGSVFKNNTNLVNIELPNSLEYLGASAFSYCSSLEEITIPKKVTEINGQTFEYCTSLKQINLHDDIVSIHGETFVGDVSLNNVILPSKITEIRGNTFEGCTSLTSIDIPNGVTRIGGHAFYGCSSLNHVSVPKTVVEIGSSAFRQCYSLENIVIPMKAYVNERAFKESPTVIQYYQNDSSNNNSQGDSANDGSQIGSPDSINKIPSRTLAENDAYNKFFYNKEAIYKKNIEEINVVDYINTNNSLGFWDASSALDNSVIAWYYDKDNNGLNELYIGANGKVLADKDSYGLFHGFPNLKSINLEGLDTSNVESMFSFFSLNPKLEAINFGDFDTSHVTGMTQMFRMCRSLRKLDLSKFNTSNVVNMNNMFGYMNSIEILDLSSFTADKLASVKDMFEADTGKSIYVTDEKLYNMIMSLQLDNTNKIYKK